MSGIKIIFFILKIVDTGLFSNWRLRMKSVIKHFKTYIIRGVIAIIPLSLTGTIVYIIYISIDQKFLILVKRIIGISFPGMGIGILLIILYITGFISTWVIGKQILNLLEKSMSKIPIINTTYQIGKQLSSTLSLPERQVFKRVVLVDFLKPGIWTVGFVTGEVIDRQNNNEKLLKVFIPTPPNPTSGTMVIVRETETRDPGWTIEQALRSVISAGIIGPEEIN